jgi:hypothetical protein
MKAGYVWDPRFNAEWYLSAPPSPRLFEMYADLLGGRGGLYTLVKSFQPRLLAPVEFPPPEIRIYRRPRIWRPAITRLYPAQTSAGAVFNRQPDGASAIAAQGVQFECGDRIYWNGDALSTVYGGPTLLSAIVPGERLASAGLVEVSVGSQDGRSAPMSFPIR